MDFEKIIDRKQTDSVKWDTIEETFNHPDVLPLWIADMDFDSPLPIKDALRRVIDEEILGYSFPGNSLLKAIIEWQKDYHDMRIEENDILFSPGVLSSIAVTIASLTEPGDSILIHDPVYPPFYSMCEKNNRHIFRSSLILSEGRYEMNFKDMESQFKKKTLSYSS